MALSATMPDPDVWIMIEGTLVPEYAFLAPARMASVSGKSSEAAQLKMTDALDAAFSTSERVPEKVFRSDDCAFFAFSSDRMYAVISN